MTEQKRTFDGDVLANLVHLAAREGDGLKLKVGADEEVRLALSGAGELTLFIVPQKSHAASAPPAMPPTPAEQPAMTEVDRRVKLRGRVGTAPVFKPLPRRGMRVGFRFAAFTGDEKPTWFDVFATGTYATALEAKGIAKGDEIELTGARQQARQRQRDGSERVVERIFAYGATIKKRAQPPS